MRNYEAMYILKPEMEEEAINAAVARFEEIAAKAGSEEIKTDRWGKKRLAYEVNGFNEGFYCLMTYKAPNDTNKELDRLLKIHDDVIRHLVIKNEE